ncbi:MAG TPA: nucleotidyltransferase family protein [Nitrososphaerales archaeon]|nr:nucleotidyltransferase family protein [Nitrososphaerales archaeon]
MSESPVPLESLDAEAERILQGAETKGIILRLLGGMAVSMRCPSASKPPLSRRRVDIDVMGRRKDVAKINQLFKELGYRPRERFNALHGSRLIFNDMKNQRRVDVFLDVFQMCHKFDFRDRLALEPKTIPLSDLLSTKLQIVEINEKDVKDIFAMLLDHEVSVGEGPDTIDAGYIAKLCAEDWGVYKTFTTNLDGLAKYAEGIGLDQERNERIADRVGKLKNSIETAPKSMGWRMRAAVGERKRWYELPEADKEVVDSAVAGS